MLKSSRYVGVRVAVGAVGLVGAVSLFSTAAWASGSSTPPSSATAPVAPGFSTVVATQVIAPSSSVQVVSTTANGNNVTLSIPAGAFGNTTVQVVVTEPTLSQLQGSLTTLNLSNYSIGSGVGIEIVDPSTGAALSGNFAQPLTVKIQASAITSQSKVIEFPTSGSPVIYSNATTGSGSAVITFSSDPGFAVANPVSATVPGATSPVTGKNFIPEGVTAGILVLGGAAVIYSARRRTSSVR